MYVPVHALGHPWGLHDQLCGHRLQRHLRPFPAGTNRVPRRRVAWLLLLLERLHASHETHFQFIPPNEFGVREGEDPSRYIKNRSKMAASFSASRPRS